jgi:hypothetical protein
MLNWLSARTILFFVRRNNRYEIWSTYIILVPNASLINKWGEAEEDRAPPLGPHISQCVCSRQTTSQDQTPKLRGIQPPFHLYRINGSIWCEPTQPTEPTSPMHSSQSINEIEVCFRPSLGPVASIRTWIGNGVGKKMELVGSHWDENAQTTLTSLLNR